jgi:hypothetical protein
MSLCSKPPGEFSSGGTPEALVAAASPRVDGARPFIRNASMSLRSKPPGRIFFWWHPGGSCCSGLAARGRREAVGLSQEQWGRGMPQALLLCDH